MNGLQERGLFKISDKYTRLTAEFQKKAMFKTILKLIY